MPPTRGTPPPDGRPLFRLPLGAWPSLLSCLGRREYGALSTASCDHHAKCDSFMASPRHRESWSGVLLDVLVDFTSLSRGRVTSPNRRDAPGRLVVDFARAAASLHESMYVLPPLASSATRSRAPPTLQGTSTRTCR